MSIQVSTVGCGDKQDAYIEDQLQKTADKGAKHPHYPLQVYSDFKDDNAPTGISVDVFGFYSHIIGKQDEKANGLSVSSAIARLSKNIELEIVEAVATEKKTPGPKAPYPGGPDWKNAPHPPTGTYEVKVQIGKSTKSFDVPFSSSGSEAPESALTTSRADIRKHVSEIITELAKVEQDQIKAGAVPSGFGISASELIFVPQAGAGKSDPYIRGNTPLLLIPVDKDLAVTGVANAIQKTLAQVKSQTGTATQASMIVEGPTEKWTFKIPLAPGQAQDKALSDNLSLIGAALEKLNTQGH